MDRNESNAKVVCIACANLFPADSPTCPTCKWRVKDKDPTVNNMVLCTLRRIARSADTIRYYMFEDRRSKGLRG